MFLMPIIRPPRSEYVDDTGKNKEFKLDNVDYVCKNFKIPNAKGEQLYCSHFVKQCEDFEQRPCLIYMHGNAGNKHEGASMVKQVLASGMDLFTFDFSGCGLSQGDWVTLGYKERQDLHAVIDYLRALGRTSKVALWGRSMGGATAIMYMADHVNDSPLPISCAVIDSCFATFDDIVNTVVG